MAKREYFITFHTDDYEVAKEVFAYTMEHKGEAKITVTKEGSHVNRMIKTPIARILMDFFKSFKPETRLGTYELQRQAIQNGYKENSVKPILSALFQAGLVDRERKKGRNRIYWLTELGQSYGTE